MRTACLGSEVTGACVYQVVWGVLANKQSLSVSTGGGGRRAAVARTTEAGKACAWSASSVATPAVFLTSLLISYHSSSSRNSVCATIVRISSSTCLLLFLWHHHPQAHHTHRSPRSPCCMLPDTPSWDPAVNLLWTPPSTRCCMHLCAQLQQQATCLLSSFCSASPRGHMHQSPTFCISVKRLVLPAVGNLVACKPMAQEAGVVHTHRHL
mmetsp:Transcript_18119/g.50748  ORF Transcript_18119/g.50748 Transcript_18119/m.50748 type:complete len:210 (+) Transcript_18119:606-1235(+)